MGAKKMNRRRAAGAKGEASGEAGASAGRAARGKRHTPEERRAAVEAFHKSGLTQAVFARQWDISHVTLGLWVRKHAAQGPRGLERVASGPAKRRGRAGLAAPVREEVVAVQRRFPDFGLKKIRHFLARFLGLRVTVRDVGPAGNCDGIKLSGLVDFRVTDVTVERWGRGGSAVDLVGCRGGTIERSTFRHDPVAGTGAGSGVRMKGCTRDVAVRRCRFVERAPAR